MRPRCATSLFGLRRAPQPTCEPREVADLLHVSPKTVSRWAKDGKLPFQRTLGGHRRYPEREIRQLAATLVGEGGVS